MTKDNQKQAREKFESMNKLEFPLAFDDIYLKYYEHECENCGKMVQNCRGSVCHFRDFTVLDVVIYCINCGTYTDCPKLKFQGDKVYNFDGESWEPLTRAFWKTVFMQLKRKLKLTKEKFLR